MLHLQPVEQALRKILIYQKEQRKNCRKSFSTTDFKCFAFSCHRIKKGTFPYGSLVYIGYAEVPHRDSGWDCKKQEVGSKCCHTTFSGPFSLCLLSYPQFQLRSEGCIMELMSKYYYEGFFPLWQVLIFNCLDISGCHTDGCSRA